jgi:hypothetical protein
MKRIVLLASLVVLAACQQQDRQTEQLSALQQESEVRNRILSLHESLSRLYSGYVANVDSVMDRYFESDMYYVTPWGTTEPLDTTKSRIRNAVSRMSDYENNLQNLTVSVYGDGAYAFFVLRQNYTVNGYHLEEYLPTTMILERRNGVWKIIHVQRSTDFETMRQYVAMQQPPAK